MRSCHCALAGSAICDKCERWSEDEHRRPYVIPWKPQVIIDYDYCPSCGIKVKSRWDYCPSCGHSLSNWNWPRITYYKTTTTDNNSSSW